MKKKILVYTLITIFLITGITFLIPIWYSILSSNFSIKLIQILLPYIVFMAVILIMNMCIEHKSWEDLGFSNKSISKQIGFGFIIWILLSILFIAIPIFFNFWLKIPFNQILPTKDNAIFFAIIYKLFFVGFGEELIFRGYLQRRIIVISDSKWVGLIITSLLFGLWHFINNGSLLQVLWTSIIGFILGYSTIKFKNCSTLSVSIAHGLYDATLALLSYFLL